MSDFEVRFTQSQMELRDQGGAPRLTGYASVFDSPSEDLGGFREVVKPGCFARTIRESDIRALVNHDPNQVLGRTKNGSLILREDSRGLYCEITPPETQAAQDFVKLVRRGDIDQMSFGFKTIRDNWLKNGTENLRELLEAQLFDVSGVTYPAYLSTSLMARSAASLAIGVRTVGTWEHSRPAETDRILAETWRDLRWAERDLDQATNRIISKARAARHPVFYSLPNVRRGA